MYCYTPEEVEKASTDILLDGLANAKKTYATCLGHTKAEGNLRQASLYKKELEKRGVHIPDDSQLYELGVFNGPGSW